MTFVMSNPDQVTDTQALDDLVREYYGVVLEKLVAAGGPSSLTPGDLMPSFTTNIQNYLPSTGRLTLVHDADGRLIGACMINQIRSDAGELKRLYVRPEADGHGLGRTIMDRQFEMARSMGWKTLLINVIKGNDGMLHISRKAGFRNIERYPECADPVELADFFVYMRCDLQ